MNREIQVMEFFLLTYLVVVIVFLFWIVYSLGYENGAKEEKE